VVLAPDPAELITKTHGLRCALSH